MESKYLVLLQEVKTPVCSSSEQTPAREVISRLLEDALQAESPEQQDQLMFKPNSVRYRNATLSVQILTTELHKGLEHQYFWTKLRQMLKKGLAQGESV